MTKSSDLCLSDNFEEKMIELFMSDFTFYS